MAATRPAQISQQIEQISSDKTLQEDLKVVSEITFNFANRLTTNLLSVAEELHFRNTKNDLENSIDRQQVWLVLLFKNY